LCELLLWPLMGCVALLSYLVTLDYSQLHEAHLRTTDRLCNNFYIDVVVLVGLHVGLQILGRHRPCIMSLFAQGPSPKVRSCVGFDPDQ
jgi:hypothetical protein